MPNVMPSEITKEVKSILENMPIDDGQRSYLTAYQILEQLPSDLKDRIIAERGTPGLGSGNYYPAASVASDAAEMLSDIDIVFLETSALSIKLSGGQDIVPGNKNIGLYRLLVH